MSTLAEFLEEHPEYRGRKNWRIFQANPQCAKCARKIDAVVIIPKMDNSYQAVSIGKNNGGYTKFTIDHIIPKSRGGPSTYDNLQTMCEPCNHKKGDDWDTSALHLYDETVIIEDVPSNYMYEINRRFTNKRLDLYYPEWKPYYGF